MPETSLRSVLIYGAVLAAVLVAGSRWLNRGDAEPVGAKASAPVMITDSRGGKVTIHVTGAVRRPGVYRLPSPARVDDAVRRAGGATAGADLSQVNLAAKLQDGRQIIVPLTPAAAAAAVAAGSKLPPGSPAVASSVPGVPLNLNTATVEQLDELDGIGPATAEKILEAREANGGFGSVEELGEVPGIGEKRLATLRDHVRV